MPTVVHAFVTIIRRNLILPVAKGQSNQELILLTALLELIAVRFQILQLIWECGTKYTIS